MSLPYFTIIVGTKLVAFFPRYKDDAANFIISTSNLKSKAMFIMVMDKLMKTGLAFLCSAMQNAIVKNVFSVLIL